MRRKSAKFHEDGILVVNKPEGLTSHDVVNAFRRRFRPGKLGHAGTLDPFATGVLVLAFNRCTRLMQVLGQGEKLYRARLALGRATDTGDHTGQVLKEAPLPQLEEAALQAAVKSLEGGRMQAPPAYSAAKHLGRPLYEYARKGVQVEKEAKPITVYRAGLTGFGPDWVDFEILCSRGTYVRSLAEDLAEALGTAGHLQKLHRAMSTPFAESEALDMAETLELKSHVVAGMLMSAGEAMRRCGLPVVKLDADQAWEIRQGAILPGSVFMAGNPALAGHAGGYFAVESAEDDEIVAVLRWLEPEARRPGRDYESIRVFPERDLPEGT